MLASFRRRCSWVVSSITRPLLNARQLLPIPPSGEAVWETNRKRFVLLRHEPADDVLFMGLRPVTEAQYNDLTATRPFSGDGSAPVVDVSWYDAVGFCNALSESEGLQPYYDIEARRKWWGGRKPPIVHRNGDANGFRLPTSDELSDASESPHGERFYETGSDLVEWCDDEGEHGGQRVFVQPGSGDADSADLHPDGKGHAIGFRVVKRGQSGLFEASADESFSEQTRRLIVRIRDGENVTPDQARVQGLLLQTLRHLDQCAAIGPIRLTLWCLLAILIWMVMSAVVAGSVLFVFPSIWLEPALYVLAGLAIVAVAVVRLTQFDTSVHFVPPESSSIPGRHEDDGPSDNLNGVARQNDRFRLGRLDDVFDLSMLVGLWALVGVLLGVQVAIALRMDQSDDIGMRLWNAGLFALDTTAGGLLLNSLDMLGLRLSHETGVPSPLTLGLRFVTFGLVCWAIFWNILRIRWFYVYGLLRDCPGAEEGTSPTRLVEWLKAKAAEFWWLPNSYADETAFLSLAAAFARGDYTYVRTLSGDFPAVNVTDDVRRLFRDPEGSIAFMGKWEPGWKRQGAQWLWSAARTQAAWLWSAAMKRLGRHTPPATASETP
jgi:hypothetical protein